MKHCGEKHEDIAQSIFHRFSQACNPSILLDVFLETFRFITPNLWLNRDALSKVHKLQNQKLLGKVNRSF